MRAVVDGRLVRQGAIGDLGHHHAVILHPQQSVGGDHADGGGVQAPLPEHAVDLLFPPLLHHQQHAFLRFGEHDLVGRHPSLALRHQLQIDLDAGTAPAAHLAGRAGQPGRAHVLNAHDGPGLHRLQTGLQQQLFHEGVAHLDIGPLLLGLLGELGRGHRGPVDAVAAGLGAHINDRVAHPAGPGIEDLVLFKDPQREHVDQGIAAVGRLEDALAGHRGHSEAVAVVGDARHHAGQDPSVAEAGLPVVQRPKPQRVHHCDRPRAHGENVPQDAAYPGGRALERLDEAGVVVRFDLEGDGVAVPDVDDAGVLPRPLHHQLAACGQFLQVQPGALVGAVFAPHHAEDAQLGVSGFAAQQRDDLLVLALGQLVRGNQLWSNCAHISLWLVACSL